MVSASFPLRRGQSAVGVGLPLEAIEKGAPSCGSGYVGIVEGVEGVDSNPAPKARFLWR